MAFPYEFIIGFGGTPVEEYPLTAREQTYAEEMPGYVMVQYYRQPVLTALLATLLGRADEVEAGLLDLREQFAVGTADGAFLDALGEDVGEDRQGRSDPVYRTFILARLAINRAHGLWDELIAIARVLYDDDDATIYVSHTGGSEGARGRIYVAEDAGTLDTEAINRQLQAMAPAGVQLTYQFTTAPEDATFHFSTLPAGEAAASFGFDNGELAGSYNNG